jgi:uncharacterized protein with HEPN domain
MNKRDRSLLEDMAAYASDAVQMLGDRDAEALIADKRTQYAVIRAVEVVGEAAAKVSAETRAALSSLPWREAVGMRNVLIHAYHEVDLGAVVRAVREHLPPLIAEIEIVLREEPQ